jgi:hypothetical protein
MSALTAWLLFKLHGSMPNYYSESLQLGGFSNYYSMMTPVDFACSQTRGLRTNNYSTWLIWLSISGATRCRSTRMMAFANTEDPWIDYLIISRLGGCYATPIIQIFQNGRFGIKIDP